MSAFYVELPANREGATQLPKAVMEGRVTSQRIRGGVPSRVLEIDGPPEAKAFTGVHVDLLGGYGITEGPARMLTPEEWAAIVAQPLARAS